jgi:hypothetical protein
MDPLSIAPPPGTPFAGQRNGTAALADTTRNTLVVGDYVLYGFVIDRGSRVALEVSRDIESLAGQMLCDAYELVVDGWCQGAGAKDEMGRSIEPSSAFARQWSAPGALERVWRRSSGDPDEAVEAFERANLALAAAVKGVPQTWNDDPERTQEDALVALVQAHSFLGPSRTAPMSLVEDLLDSIDHYPSVPGLLLDDSA